MEKNSRISDRVSRTLWGHAEGVEWLALYPSITYQRVLTLVAKCNSWGKDMNCMNGFKYYGCSSRHWRRSYRSIFWNCRHRIRTEYLLYCWCRDHSWGTFCYCICWDRLLRPHQRDAVLSWGMRIVEKAHETVPSELEYSEWKFVIFEEYKLEA